MLVTLRRIVREVGAAPTLDDALAIIVRQVKNAVRVDACAVYLADEEQDEYVLVAADGLSPAAVGRVRVSRREGLLGRVGERKELIAVTDVRAHPDYRPLAETGEERFGSFLGMPLIHYHRVLGVLVAWKPAHHPYAKEEVSFFLSIAAQLAKAIHEAAAIDTVGRLLRGEAPGDAFVQGVPAATGLAIGKVVWLDPHIRLESIPDRGVRDGAAEERVFRAAVAAAQHDLRSGTEHLAGVLPDEVRALFDAYAMLLGSRSLVSDTIERIRAGNWAPGAWRETIASHARVFEQMEDPYLRARAEDIREIGQRVLLHLQSEVEASRAYPQRCILVGEAIGVTEIAAAPEGCLAGIVSMRGSPLSHMAVLARALGIPAVVSLAPLPNGRLEGREMAVDGHQGRVYIEPSPTLVRVFQRRIREENALSERLVSIRDLPAETLDGVRVPLYANIGLASDSAVAAASGAEGIGLYRTEYDFLLGDAFPVEEEQFQRYRGVLEFFAPLPVTLRTLDVGGDKLLPYFPAEEDNPFLGCRGIRFSLDHPEIFLIQLRAMLRGNAGLDNLQVLFPMIGKVNELDEALGLLARAHRELLEEGQDAARPRVGVMIEVPAAVFLIGPLAQRVDFFSVGTNDLTQYMLAVDRNNALVVTPYDSLHPAVLNAIRQVIETAHLHGRPVSVCGEMAGDPAGALLLLGMGVDALSMSPPLLARVKLAIRTFTRQRARVLVDAALGLEDGFAVHRLMNGALEQVEELSGIYSHIP
jgi:phosphotransferase system enzyme I (PtsP)